MTRSGGGSRVSGVRARGRGGHRGAWGAGLHAFQPGRQNMRRTSALAATALTVLAACTPTSTPTSNTTAGGGPTPTCAFARNQTSNDLRMNCTISGALANTLIDPAHGGGSTCANTSLSLFSQT